MSIEQVTDHISSILIQRYPDIGPPRLSEADGHHFMEWSIGPRWIEVEVFPDGQIEIIAFDDKRARWGLEENWDPKEGIPVDIVFVMEDD